MSKHPSTWSEFFKNSLASFGRSKLKRRVLMALPLLTVAAAVLGVVGEVNSWKNATIWTVLIVILVVRELLQYGLDHLVGPVTESVWTDVDNQAKARGAHMRMLLLQASEPNADNHKLWNLQRALLQHAVRELAIRGGENEDAFSASWGVPEDGGFRVVARNRSNSEPGRVEDTKHVFRTHGDKKPCPGAAEAAQTRKPSVVADTHQHPDCFDEASLNRYRSFINVPVYVSDREQRVVGFLSIDHHTEPNKFAEAHALAVEDVAYLLAVCDRLKKENNP